MLPDLEGFTQLLNMLEITAHYELSERLFQAFTLGKLEGKHSHVHRPVAGRRGLGVRTPPELLRVTFLNRVNPETFCGGRGRGGGGVEVTV